MKQPVLSTARVLLLSALLLPTAALLQLRAGMEIHPQVADLESLPESIADWRGHDQTLDPDILQTLGKGSYLSRLYNSPTLPPIDLFIAYYSTQQSGDTIHSPKNCLPGSGWTPIESGRIWFPVYKSKSIRVNRYIVAQGMDRQLVIYWYQAHGRVVASEYAAKALLVADSIRRNRSDGGMVRLVTPILPNETIDQTQARALEFARALFPMLDSYIPK